MSNQVIYKQQTVSLIAETPNWIKFVAPSTKLSPLIAGARNTTGLSLSTEEY